MSVTHFSERAVVLSTPIQFIGSQRPENNSLADEKIGQIRDNFFSHSCLPNLLGGIAGSLVTKHPLPFLVGLSTCFPPVFAQQRVGGEFQVNTYTTGIQTLPSVSSLSNGGFLVAWEDSSKDGSGYGIFAQIFNATGAKVGSQFQVNTYTTADQFAPSVSSLSNGDFVIAWEDDSALDGSYYGIFAQIFNATGVKVGSQFQVNTYTPQSQQQASVSSLSNGDFVVAWHDNSSLDGSGYGIFAQIFNATGAKVGSQFQVNVYFTGNQLYPSTSSLSNGDFVVAWEDQSGEDGSGYGVFGQMFSATGTNVGGQFQVNTFTPGNQYRPSISSLSNGNFVVAWYDDSGLDGSGFGVFGQMFNATAIKVGGQYKIGSQFQVNTYTTGNQSYPLISSLSNGEFVICWNDQSGEDGSGNGVFGQLFDPTGAKVGSQFQVNTHTTGNQGYQSIASLSNGDFVVAFADDSGYDGNSSGVFGQIFDATVVPFTSASAATLPLTSGATTQVTPISSGSIATTVGATTFTGSTQSSSSTTTAQTTTSKASNTGSAATSSTGGSKSIPWLWPLIGAAGGVSCIGLSLTSYFLYKKRSSYRQEKGVSSEELGSINTHASSLSPEREEGYTKIGKRYELIKKITRDDAPRLLRQTGIQVHFPDRKFKTEVLIGSGNFGKLRIARNIETQEFVAVKKVKGTNEIEQSRNEGAIQAQLIGKPNILPILDFVESLSSNKEPVLYQFMLLAGFGNGEELQAHLNARESIQSPVILHVAQGLANGLYHMHKAGIYHLDIKLSNLVLDMKGELFIIDFGCAKEFKDGQIDGSAIGDSRYFSPERLNRGRQRAQGVGIDPIAADKVDAWALGLTILELATGNYPFDQCDIMEKYRKWDSAYFQEKLDGIDFLQQQGSLNDIVRELLDVDPDKRLSVKDARSRLRRLQSFAGKEEQEDFFVNLKQETIIGKRKSVLRDQDENYGNVYYSKHKNAELLDYQGTVNEFSKKPGVPKNEYSKTPSFLG